MKVTVFRANTSQIEANLAQIDTNLGRIAEALEKMAASRSTGLTSRYTDIEDGPGRPTPSIRWATDADALAQEDEAARAL